MLIVTLSYEVVFFFYCFRWAARVLVNSDEACHHGRKVGGSTLYICSLSMEWWEIGE